MSIGHGPRPLNWTAGSVAGDSTAEDEEVREEEGMILVASNGVRLDEPDPLRFDAFTRVQWSCIVR